MTRIRYDIVPSADGWRISCNDVEGPAYSRQAEAIRDALFIAEQLKSNGDRVTVRTLEMDGPRRVWRPLELKDAHLYRDPI